MPNRMATPLSAARMRGMIFRCTPMLSCTRKLGRYCVVRICWAGVRRCKTACQRGVLNGLHTTQIRLFIHAAAAGRRRCRACVARPCSQQGVREHGTQHQRGRAPHPRAKALCFTALAQREARGEKRRDDCELHHEGEHDVDDEENLCERRGRVYVACTRAERGVGTLRLAACEGRRGSGEVVVELQVSTGGTKQGSAP